MLPDGFHWQGGREPRLMLGEHLIAVTAELPRGWRHQLQPDDAQERVRA